jgi:hypothetical protein
MRELTAVPGALSWHFQEIVTSDPDAVAALSDCYQRIVAPARQHFDSGSWFCCGSTSLPTRKEPLMPAPANSGLVWPFDALEDTFGLLVAGPSPLAIDGRQVRGLPPRPVPLDELRGRLLHPSVSYRTRDVALVVLLRHARRERERDGVGGAWTVGLCGVVLPALRRAAVPLAHAVPGKAADLEAEMLAGLVEAIGTVPGSAERLAARLVWPAVRAGHRFVRRERGWRTWEAPHASLAAPQRSPSHPDLVLEAAVQAGVLSAGAAELVGETRVGGVPLRVLARQWGVSYQGLRRRRIRSEPALIAWLVSRRMFQNGA